MKTNKHQTLLLVKSKGAVRASDIVAGFNYSPATARSYLAHLGRQDLVQRTGAGHVLSEKGENRIQFFEVAGCGDPDCPLCQGKEAFYSCPTCGRKVPKEKAILKAEWDTVFFRREAGVYCGLCQCQIFTEQQARIAGIREETK